ncbi:Ataxin-7-like protein 3 [Coemansia sp. RSA 988]|nr:Ataxin-7-like protein 3 [Coemansia sp. RSA 988]
MKPKAEGGDSAAFDELLHYYDSKIDMLRLARNSLETAKPAITPPASPDGNDSEPPSRALLALELYQEMIDELMMGVVFETHYETKQNAAVCVLCNTQCQLDDNDNGGNNSSSQPSGSQGITDAFECPSCQRSYPAARFAAHMDKCMGLSSRRAATRSRSAVNSTASTPAHPSGNYDSSSEHSADRRRRLAKRVRRV